jgi:hypothetical protein
VTRAALVSSTNGINFSTNRKRATMYFSFDLINGLCFGIEFVGKDLDDGIDESVIIVEFAFFRMTIWLNDFEE